MTDMLVRDLVMESIDKETGRVGIQLTRAQGWRFIAEKIDAGEWSKKGLCWEVTDLHWRDKLISKKVCMEMYEQTGYKYGESELSHLGFAFPVGEGPVRVLAALFLALEAEDEETV